MKAADLRKELLKIMPGYKWTVHKALTPGRLVATGIKTMGFNRLSTLQVILSEPNGNARYEVRSSGFGMKAAWLGVAEDCTLARALRNLQNYYETMAATYGGHANALRRARQKGGEA